jgi:hypothetical protein
MEALFGALVMFSIRQYYVAATTRRLFALRLSKRSAKRLTVELAEPFEHLRIEREKSGPLWTQVWVRRMSPDMLLRFRIVRTEQSRAERVFASLPRG